MRDQHLELQSLIPECSQSNRNFVFLIFCKSHGHYRYYESTGVYDKASTMFRKCGEYDKALSLILQLGTHEAMEFVRFVVSIQHSN